MGACLITCSIGEDAPKDYFGFCKEDFIVLDETDTHSGFHGDGSYHFILDCSGNEEIATEILKEWIELPLSENLELIMYGGEKDGTTITSSTILNVRWGLTNFNMAKGGIV